MLRTARQHVATKLLRRDATLAAHLQGNGLSSLQRSSPIPSHCFSTTIGRGEQGPLRKPFYVTTPIFYVNAGNPQLSLLLTVAFAR